MNVIVYATYGTTILASGIVGILTFKHCFGIFFYASNPTTPFVSQQIFRNSLHPPDYQSRLEIVRANSKQSLNRTGTSMSKSGTLQVSAC